MLRWTHKDVNDKIQEALQQAYNLRNQATQMGGPMMNPLMKLRQAVQSAKTKMGIPQREM